MKQTDECKSCDMEIEEINFRDRQWWMMNMLIGRLIFPQCIIM